MKRVGCPWLPTQLNLVTGFRVVQIWPLAILLPDFYQYITNTGILSIVDIFKRQMNSYHFHWSKTPSEWHSLGNTLVSPKKSMSPWLELGDLSWALMSAMCQNSTFIEVDMSDYKDTERTFLEDLKNHKGQVNSMSNYWWESMNHI